MSGSAATFPAFFGRRHAGLSRPACLLTGDATVADDLAADALSRIRRDWARLGGDDPAAHARGIVATLARRRERWAGAPGRGTVPQLRDALRRVCVVLRYASGS